MSFLKGEATLYTQEYTILSVVPQNPYKEIREPKTPEERAKSIPLVMIGFAEVILAELPLDFSEEGRTSCVHPGKTMEWVS